MNELLRAALRLPPQASQAARDLDHLHFAVILTTLAGAAAVGALSAYYVVRYRRRGVAPATPDVETTWRVEGPLVAATLALFLSFWAVGYRQYLAANAPPEGAMDVYVTAKQWMWKFSRADGSRSAGDLVVPAGRPVRLVMTSRDVIHSFYVPALRLKQDVLPGRYVTAWFVADRPGEYEVLCAEYCGVDHSRMRARLVVLSPDDYASWLSREGHSDLGGEDLARRGREVAARRQCFACHTADGQPHVGPTWRGLFGSERTLSDGARVTADAAYLTRSMMEPQAQMVAGYQPLMPSYLGVLDAGEAAALVEYIRSLRDHGEPSAVRLPPARVVADGGAP